MTSDELNTLLLTLQPHEIVGTHGHAEWADFEQHLYQLQSGNKAAQVLAQQLLVWLFVDAPGERRNPGTAYSRNNTLVHFVYSAIRRVICRNRVPGYAALMQCTQTHNPHSAHTVIAELDGVLRRDFSVDGTEQHAEARNKLFDAREALRAHSFGTSFAWHKAAACVDHPNAHLRLLHMLTHNTTKGRPRVTP